MTNWSRATAPDLDSFEAMADAAMQGLPPEFLALCGRVVLQIEDFPSAEVVADMGLQSEFDILGLFQRVGLPFQSETQPMLEPNRVFLYRRPILDYWAEHEERLGDIVRHVLVHEIGHHFGLSDDDIDRIEAEAG